MATASTDELNTWIKKIVEKSRERDKAQEELEKTRSELVGIQGKINDISKDLESKNVNLSTLKVTLDKEQELKNSLSRQLDDLQK